MKTIAFFLEEPSAKEMLHGILPRILPSGVQVRYVVFQGKQDLEKNLKSKLQGWRLPDSSFVVMRDQDSGDCGKIKTKLVEMCKETGRDSVLVRIACRELESFYLGDLKAVEKGLAVKGLERKQQTKKFRDPDVLNNPTEELGRLTGYTYQKLSGSRAIAPHLRLDKNRSKSFMTLISGLRRIVEDL